MASASSVWPATVVLVDEVGAAAAVVVGAAVVGGAAVEVVAPAVVEVAPAMVVVSSAEPVPDPIPPTATISSTATPARAPARRADRAGECVRSGAERGSPAAGAAGRGDADDIEPTSRPRAWELGERPFNNV